MSKKMLMKPFKALASPGIYLYGKLHQYKKERQERRRTEKKLTELSSTIDSLLKKANQICTEVALTTDEECVICVNAKAVTRTMPCGHKVLCKICFLKTIQTALQQRVLPLRCVMCRTKVRSVEHEKRKPSDLNYAQKQSAYNRRIRGDRSANRRTWHTSSKDSKHSLPTPGVCSKSLVENRCCRSCSLPSCSSSFASSKTQISMCSSRFSTKPLVQTTNKSSETAEYNKFSPDKNTIRSREELIQEFKREYRKGRLLSMELQKWHMQKEQLSTKMSTQNQLSGTLTKSEKPHIQNGKTSDTEMKELNNKLDLPKFVKCNCNVSRENPNIMNVSKMKNQKVDLDSKCSMKNKEEKLIKKHKKENKIGFIKRIRKKN